jgi:hypothetical protein
VKDKRKQAKEQLKFCEELMKRLVKSANENIDIDLSWCGIRNHTQMINDIVRLRRELNTLHKLLTTEW